MDNASANGVMAKVVCKIFSQHYDTHLDPTNTQVRCCPHGGNRIAQTLLSGVDEADDPELLDYFLEHRNEPIHFSLDDDEKLQEFEKEKEVAKLGDEEDPVLEWAEEAELLGKTALSPVKRVSSMPLQSMSVLMVSIGSYALSLRRLFPRHSAGLPSVQWSSSMQKRSTRFL